MLKPHFFKSVHVKVFISIDGLHSEWLLGFTQDWSYDRTGSSALAFIISSLSVSVFFSLIK